jgi:hypothetical protein
LGSPGVDWWWWHGRRWLRRAAAVRSWRRARCGSGSSECEGNARQQAAVGARVRSREELGSLGRRRERAEGGARLRRRQWRAAGSRAGAAMAVFYSRGACRGYLASRLSVQRVNVRGTATLGVRVRRAHTPAKATSWSARMRQASSTLMH